MNGRAVSRLIRRYNEAWGWHDLEAIVALHAPGMVFENHTAGERAGGEAVRDHIAGIFEAWPDLAFSTRTLRCRADLAVCEWTARAAHSRPLRRGDLVAEPTGRRLSWRGVDIFTIDGGLIERKDVYSDSVAILRGVGLLG